MTIEKLKKALVEVADICEKNTCFSCPFSFFNEDTDEFDCPLWNATVDVNPPEEWRVDKLREGTNNAAQRAD